MISRELPDMAAGYYALVREMSKVIGYVPAKLRLNPIDVCLSADVENLTLSEFLQLPIQSGVDVCVRHFAALDVLCTIGNADIDAVLSQLVFEPTETHRRDVTLYLHRPNGQSMQVVVTHDNCVLRTSANINMCDVTNSLPLDVFLLTQLQWTMFSWLRRNCIDLALGSLEYHIDSLSLFPSNETEDLIRTTLTTVIENVRILYARTLGWQSLAIPISPIPPEPPRGILMPQVFTFAPYNVAQDILTGYATPEMTASNRWYVHNTAKVMQ